MMNNTNNTNNTNNSSQNLNKELIITRTDLEIMLEHSNNLAHMGEGRVTIPWNKDSLVNIINKNLGKAREQGCFTNDYLNNTLTMYTKWRHKNAGLNFKLDEIWAKVKNQHLVTNIINEKKELTNSNIYDYIQFLHTNKEIVRSGLELTKPLAKNKPLGNAGDFTINELINKGLDLVDIPLVQMIRENVDISVAGTYLTSMIMYKTIVNLYVKSAYSSTFTDIVLSAPSTRSKELAFFMLMGVPFVVGFMWAGNKIVGGKVVVNVLANNELEGMCKANSVNKNELDVTSRTSRTSRTSSSSFCIFLKKLPSLLKSWLKAILNYLALYFIGLVILNVMGVKTNTILEIYSNLTVYLGYFLKLYLILNILVIIYFIWKLYVIVNYAKNKNYINPDDYHKFIKNELKESKYIAISAYLKYPDKVYKHYLKLIFLYSSIVFFGVIVIILYAS